MENQSNKLPEKSKIVHLEIDEAKNVRKESIGNNEELLEHSFKLLKRNIELLKDSQKWIKEMIRFSKENAKQDAFFKEQEVESSLNDHSYTVGDVEKEMQNIEKIETEIKEIHDLITESQLDIIKEQERLEMLNKMEVEFREILASINPEQEN